MYSVYGGARSGPGRTRREESKLQGSYTSPHNLNAIAVQCEGREYRSGPIGYASHGYLAWCRSARPQSTAVVIRPHCSRGEPPAAVAKVTLRLRLIPRAPNTSSFCAPPSVRSLTFLASKQQDKFQGMSDKIVGRIDDMGSRIDDLEKALNDLMAQAGVEEDPQ